MDAQDQQRGLTHLRAAQARIGSHGARPATPMREAEPLVPEVAAEPPDEGDWAVERERLTAVIADLEAENRRLRHALVEVAEHASGAAGVRGRTAP